MAYFDKCVVRINESGVMADSVNIQTDNGLAPVYVIGKRGILGQNSESPIENRFNISYYLNLSKEPTYPIVCTLKNLIGQYHGTTIDACGITGYNCYLLNYGLKVAPNQLVQVTTSWISYQPLSGDINIRPTGDRSLFFTGYSGNLAMGWTTHIVSGTSYLTAPTYDFEYSFTPNWQPIYHLNRRVPSQVEFFGATEKMSFTRDTFKHLPYSGEIAARDSNSAFIKTNGNDADIDFYGYNYINDPTQTVPTMSISLTDAMIENIDLQAAIDDIVRTITTVAKYY